MTFSDKHFDEDYYRANGQLGDRPALRYYTRLVRRYLGEGPYLDFGCGTGFLMKHLSTLGQVSGFEVSSFSADQARRADVGATVYSAPDDIPGDTFGGVAAIHVVEHLDDVVADAAVATWSRILRAGGRALVVTPDPGGRARTLAGDTWNGFSDETHINLKPHGEWLAFFEERELKVIRHGSDGLWNVPYSGRPKLVDAMVYAVPALAQFLSGRLFLPPGSGESSIFVLEKS